MAEVNRMRSPPAGPVAHARLAHGHRADAGHDLALRQMAVAHHAPAAIAVAGRHGCPRKSRHLRLDGLGQQSTRAVAQNLGERIVNVPGWVSLMTLVSVTAYHSFGGEVEARTPPRYAALPLHAVTNFRADFMVTPAGFEPATLRLGI
jgi:hypothetical protein